jgi:predicted Na+-dependent transporter
MEFKLKNFFRKELIIFPIVCWLILPVIVYYGTSWMDSALQIGFLLVVITPPALASPVMVSLANGDLEYSVANVTIFNILSPLIFATLPRIFIRDTSLSINYLNIFLRVALIIFLPLILAFLSNKVSGVKAFVLKRIDPYKALIQMFLITIAVANSAKQIRAMDGMLFLSLFALIFVIAGILYLIGWMIPKQNKMKYTLAIANGHKNTLLTITIAIASFSEITALPAVFYLIAHHTYNGIVINLSRKSDTKSART